MIRTTIRLPEIVHYAYHGVEPREQAVGQPFSVDLKLWIDAENAAQSDNLKDTIDYTQLYAEVYAQLQGPPAQLLEHLAYRIAAAIMKKFPQIHKLRIRISKPEARIGDNSQHPIVQLLLKHKHLKQ